MNGKRNRTIKGILTKINLINESFQVLQDEELKAQEDPELDKEDLMESRFLVDIVKERSSELEALKLELENFLFHE